MRPVPGQLRLSLAAYSLRDRLTKKNDAMNLFQFVEGASFFAVSGVESGEYEALRPVAAAHPDRVKPAA